MPGESERELARSVHSAAHHVAGADGSNYPENKLSENITAEIMMTCVNETRESYDENIVVELQSDGSGGENEVENNVHRIAQWVEQWTKDRQAGVHEDED